MFHDMSHASIVKGWRTEADGKYLVIIIILQEEKAGTALFVLHGPGNGAGLLAFAAIYNLKSMNMVIHLHKITPVIGIKIYY
jgi:hypothetical protein